MGATRLATGATGRLSRHLPEASRAATSTPDGCVWLLSSRLLSRLVEFGVTRISAFLLAWLVLFAVTGCGTGGPPKRVFPPEARIQELRLQPGGATLHLRIENFSTVPATLERVALSLRLGEGAALPVSATPGIRLLPQSAEVIELPLALPEDERQRILAAIAQRQTLRYRLDGTLGVDPPGRDQRIDYASALSPVPGLDGVMR